MKAALATLMMCGAVGAKAGDYVFMYVDGSTFHILANSNDIISDVNQFNSAQCIWSGTSGGTFSNQSRYLYWTNNNSVWTANTSGDNLTINQNKIYNTYDRYNVYVRYSDNQWISSTTNDNNNVVYKLSGPTTASLNTPTISTSTSTFTSLSTVDYDCTCTGTPAYYTLTPNSSGTTYYAVEGKSPSTTAPAADITYNWQLSDDGSNWSSDNGHVRINAATGEVTYYNAYSDNNHTVKIRVTASVGTLTRTSTAKDITFNKLTAANPTSITATDVTMEVGATITASNYTVEATGLSAGQYAYNYVSATSSNTSVVTVTNTNGTFSITGVAVGTATITVTAHKTDNTASSVTTTFKVTVEKIETGVSGGVVTLDDREDHSWSYYSDPSCPIRSLNPANVKITYYGNGEKTISTTNGATPANSSWTENATTVKVGPSESANTFVYYKTLERTDGGTATSVAGATGRCAYTTIPNPFSVRPTYQYETGTLNKYCGFYAWRVKKLSGGTIHSAASGGTSYGVNSIINAETQIYFAPTSEYGMDVEFEALWARAWVVTSNNTSGMNNGVTYERNFVYLSSNTTLRAAALSYPVTYTTLDPATGAGTKRTITIRDGFTCGADTKFENLTFAQYGGNSQTLTAAAKKLTIGRGCSGLIALVRGLSTSISNVEYRIRIESGEYTEVVAVSNSERAADYGTGHALLTLGCDYDRALVNNDNLDIEALFGGNVEYFNNSNARIGIESIGYVIKSGSYNKNIAIDRAAEEECIYMAIFNGRDMGTRSLLVEGGNLNSLAGGQEHYTSGAQNSNKVNIRIKGGTVRGSIYGAAAWYNADGNRRIIITGGSVKGWIAGGCNGRTTDGGATTGSSYIYVGGNAEVGNPDNPSADIHIGATISGQGTNGADGGNIFGAGCGINPASGNVSSLSVGKMYASTIVVADNSRISKNVYGGGNFGFIGTDGGDKSSNIYILGGTVKGNVYGGSNNQQGQTVNILMKGGTVESGIYGGSNTWGTINNDVTIQVNGGQVGVDADHTANIHGGGYGNATNVNGNILVNIGEKGQTATGAMIYGDVYGGSALGNVNDAISDSVAIGLYRGTIQGNVYGGGLGNNTYAAAVRGNVRVDVDGIAFVTTYDGTNASDDSPIPATGRIFGCNNNNGTPNGSVRINVYKTARADGAVHTRGEYEVQAVYGGGNLAAYTPTTNQATSVNVYGCGESSIEYVYGGGNAAPVPATDVNVYGSYEINYVFGGGNGKDDVNGAANPGADVGKRKDGTSYGSETVVGTANTEILGGVIHHVFGGSNTKGDVTKAAHVILGDQNLQFCEFKVDEVYGAGNEAYMSGDAEITMNCIEGLTAIYGGSRKADIGSPTSRKDVVLNVYGGHFDQVFGGNNESGCIYGSITVNIQEKGCLPIEIGELYLGGNKAAYSVYGYNNDKTPKTSGTSYGDPVLNIISATSIGTTYGGGLGSTATLYGNPRVNINMEQGSINGKYEYEEGKSAERYKGKGYETAKTLDLGHLGTVYGGGNEAKVVGDTYIQIGTGTDAAGATLTRQDAQISGNVYGGGNHAEVTGKTNVVVGK